MSRTDVERQLMHWSAAIERLEGWQHWAALEAWRNLECSLGINLVKHFSESISTLAKKAAVGRVMMTGANSPEQLDKVRRQVLSVRREFVQVETLLDFFGDAINTRTGAEIAALLHACDILAEKSMRQLLDQFDQPTPPVLTYLDKGMGASILKAGLRLWDGRTVNPVSAIKIVRHNLLRPTSLIHEAGHQAAHQLDWNNQLAVALNEGIKSTSTTLATTWSEWASEIAADVFAFVHTGYASVAALHDVLAGEEELVFAIRPGDPHPMSFLRVLLGVEFCRLAYGRGPWDDLSESWNSTHRIASADAEARELATASTRLLPDIAQICLSRPLASFGGRPVTKIIDPMRVGPAELERLESEHGESLYRSASVVYSECLRATSLTGYRSAINPRQANEFWKKQKSMMLLLGGGRQLHMKKVA